MRVPLQRRGQQIANLAISVLAPGLGVDDPSFRQTAIAATTSWTSRKRIWRADRQRRRAPKATWRIWTRFIAFAYLRNEQDLDLNAFPVLGL